MIQISIAGYKTLSEISRDMGQVFFASMFIEPMLSGRLNWLTICIGGTLCLLSFASSFLLAEQASRPLY